MMFAVLIVGVIALLLTEWILDRRRLNARRQLDAEQLRAFALNRAGSESPALETEQMLMGIILIRVDAVDETMWSQVQGAACRQIRDTLKHVKIKDPRLPEGGIHLQAKVIIEPTELPAGLFKSATP